MSSPTSTCKWSPYSVSCAMLSSLGTVAVLSSLCVLQIRLQKSTQLWMIPLNQCTCLHTTVLRQYLFLLHLEGSFRARSWVLSSSDHLSVILLDGLTLLCCCSGDESWGDKCSAHLNWAVSKSTCKTKQQGLWLLPAEQKRDGFRCSATYPLPFGTNIKKCSGAPCTPSEIKESPNEPNLSAQNCGRIQCLLCWQRKRWYKLLRVWFGHLPREVLWLFLMSMYKTRFTWWENESWEYSMAFALSLSHHRVFNLHRSSLLYPKSGNNKNSESSRRYKEEEEEHAALH